MELLSSRRIGLTSSSTWMFPPPSPGEGGNNDRKQGTGEADGEDAAADEEEAMALSAVNKYF